MKKSVLFLSILLFIITGTMFYFIAQFLYEDKEKDLKEALIEKVKASVYAAQNDINARINQSDDIGLLISVQLLSKTENILSVFVLDKDKNPSAIGKTADLPPLLSLEPSDIVFNALNSRGELLQSATGGSSVFLSIPLAKENTLFCLISLEKADSAAKKWRFFCFAAALAADIFIILIFYILSRVFIVFPFNRKSKALQKAKDEIENISAQAAGTADENKKNLESMSFLSSENKKINSVLNIFIDEISKNASVFILLDRSSNLISAFDKTGRILMENFEKRGAISLAAADTEIIKLIEKSIRKPFLKIESRINGVELFALSIPSESSPFFTAVIGKN